MTILGIESYQFRVVGELTVRAPVMEDDTLIAVPAELCKVTGPLTDPEPAKLIELDPNTASPPVVAEFTITVRVVPEPVTPNVPVHGDMVRLKLKPAVMWVKAPAAGPPASKKRRAGVRTRRGSGLNSKTQVSAYYSCRTRSQPSMQC
jgi:hypothetical protein